MKMGAFVGVAKGSVEEPYLLEMKYSGGSDSNNNIVLVGKGMSSFCLYIYLQSYHFTHKKAFNVTNSISTVILLPLSARSTFYVCVSGAL